MIDIRALKAEQLEKAQQVIVEDTFDSEKVTCIAGIDVGFEDGGTVTRAAIAILDYPSLKLVDYKIARIETTMPYIPGFLSYREYPALLAAWKKLTKKPELIFVDGHGVAHPRGLGIASHFGLLVNVPTIGIAKKKLYGKHEPLGLSQNSVEKLFDINQQIGWVFRSKLRCNPLYISSGHGISQDRALAWVQQCMKGYRLPEPTRWADAISSNRSAFKNLKQIEINKLMN